VEEHNSPKDALDSNTVNSDDQTQHDHVSSLSKNYPEHFHYCGFLSFGIPRKNRKNGYPEDFPYPPGHYRGNGGGFIPSLRLKYDGAPAEIDKSAKEHTSASETIHHAKEQTRSVEQLIKAALENSTGSMYERQQELYSQNAAWKMPECNRRRTPTVPKEEEFDRERRYAKIDPINTIVDGMTPVEEDNDRLGRVSFRPKAPYKDRKDMMRSTSPRWRRVSPYDPRRASMQLGLPRRIVPHQTRELLDRRGRSVLPGIEPAEVEFLHGDSHIASGDLAEHHSEDARQDISAESISDETSDVSAQEIAYYKDRYESMRGAFNREFHQTVLMKRQADTAEKERDDYKKKVVELEAKVDFLEEQLGYKRRIADLEKLARLDVTEQEKHE
jgi:hypothetical protein